MKKRSNRKNASQLAGKPKNRYERQAQRYIEKKKSAQKVKKIPDKLTKYQLEEAKYKLENLVNEANKRIEMIKAAGYTSYALDRVIQEGGGRDFFTLDDVNTREELVRESTRLRVFINDKGSSVEGAKLETVQILADKYKGKFGNEYNKKEYNYAKYDINAIDKTIAERAFKNYRIIEENRASQITEKLGGYGSENLITALYDAEVRGLDSQVYGMELLDTFIEFNSKEGENAREKANLVSGITGIIEDNIKGGYLF